MHMQDINKTILIGNGFTSNLIKSYKDSQMIQKFIEFDKNLYNEINGLFDPFRKLEIKNEFSITNVMKMLGLKTNLYKRYFIEYNLSNELNKKKILAIESLLKVAYFFNHPGYEQIKQIANIIYYNDGNNGLEHINNKIDKKLLYKFLQGFTLVFTTNFDNILDDAYDGEVYHLHGGFKYKRIHNSNGSVYIEKDMNVSPDKSHLIWGHRAEEKLQQTQAGIAYPMKYPRSYGSSILDAYYKALKNAEFDELYIWGYSGLNDGHINNAIAINKNIKKIIFYCPPNKVDNDDYCLKYKKLFIPVNNTTTEFHLESWDAKWDELDPSK